MQASEQVKFGAAIMALGAAYRADVSDHLLEAYVIALDDVPLERTIAAVRKAIRTGGHFMPSPSDLREMCGIAKLPYHAPWRGHQWQINAADDTKLKLLPGKDGDK